MKFFWRHMMVENLWTRFFKAKYVKSFHMDTTRPNPIGSPFWKAILKVFLQVYENSCIKIYKGKASFWFNKWLSLGPLAKNTTMLQWQTMKINEWWIMDHWDVEKLKVLVRDNKIEQISLSTIKFKVGPDVFIYKLSINGTFSMASTWEVTRKKEEQTQWIDWVQNNLLPKKVSLCMWKAMFQVSPFND